MTPRADDLPVGWELPAISEVTETVPSVDPTKQPNQTFHYVDISSIDNRRHTLTEAKPLLGAQAPSRARRPIQDGDVLFSNVRTYLRNIARVNGISEPALASTGFTLLRPTSRVTQDYLFRYVTSDAFIADVTPLQTGSHYPATSDRVVRAQLIPLPPLHQQRGIARLLDRIGEHRNAAAIHLAQAQQTLNDFRHTVLSAACTGRLTEDWRRAHPDAASVERAISDLADARRRRKQVTPLSDLEPPGVPQTWAVATVADAAEVLEYGTSKKSESAAGGVPVIRMGNIQNGDLLLDDLKYCDDDAEIQRLMLRDGDLLFNRTNSPELVGKTAVYHKSTAMTFASYLIRVRFAAHVADPDFVSYWINSAWGRVWARRVKTDGVSQSNINGTKLGAMPLPLPPIEEQREIVHRVGALLDLGSQVQAKIQQSGKSLDQAGQAALAKAFRGELRA